jgi:hypothetical protein
MNIWKRNNGNDELRQYLLGRLSGSARENLERRVLNEAEVNDEVQAMEDELIDQYLRGRLNARERKQFESYFLIPEERQRKLRFGRTLRRYLDSLPRVKANQDSKSTWVRFSWLEARPVLVASLLLVIGLGVLSVFWLVTHKRAGGGVTGNTLAITLDSGSSRANGGKIQRLELPASYGSVEVQLELGSNEYSDYEVALLRERRLLTTYKSLRPQNKDGHTVLAVLIPANMLEPGDYTFTLSGTTNSGQTEYKDQYQLRVTPAR